MAGDLPGVTDLTGLRLGDNTTRGSAITWSAWTSVLASAVSAVGVQNSSVTVPFSNVTPGDILIITTRSALSNSVDLSGSYISAPGIVALIYSNASTTTLSQSAVTVDMAAFRMSNATRF